MGVAFPLWSALLSGKTVPRVCEPRISGSPNQGGRFGCGVLPSGGDRKNGPVAH